MTPANIVSQNPMECAMKLLDWLRRWRRHSADRKALAHMESIIHDPTWATQFSIKQLVEKAGTQGIELLMWLATRGALGATVRCVHRNYHLPISNTASGLMLLEPSA